ncbi:hypothetical protein QJQ45_018285 [Haematococcus lacustris]|nr:hypothetical protein QJQ45_018285 [Haematococcus lacustris]
MGAFEIYAARSTSPTRASTIASTASASPMTQYQNPSR